MAYLLAFPYLCSLVFSPVYLVWATVRSSDRRRLPPNPVDVVALGAQRALTGDADVVFEALWGMVLALPAVALALFMLVDPAALPFGIWLAIFALLGIYVIAILACNRVALARWARWLPAIFAIVATPLLAAVAADVGMWLWASFLLYSRLGIGYIADVVVGVRFARAVRSRDQARALANEPATRSEASDFVWPY